MKKTKNSTPSSEWESKDKCPSCGSFCDIHKDLDENDKCNNCRVIMQYSTNPKDWYFDVYHDSDEDLTLLALTMDESCLDDDLGTDNLPEEIVNLLLSIGINAVIEHEESIFSLDTDMPWEQLFVEIKALGFNYRDIFNN